MFAQKHKYTNVELNWSNATGAFKWIGDNPEVVKMHKVLIRKNEYANTFLSEIY